MSVVYVKTSKGLGEIEQRGGALAPRVRRVLIMLDGKRNVEDIRAMALVEDLSHALVLLEESGYIELLKQPVALATTAAASVAPSPAPAFREIPEVRDPKQLEMAKHFIMNTLKTFCGPLTHLSIYEAVQAARSHEELRRQFEPWYAAIINTRDGRRRAEELSANLLKVI